MSKETVTFTVGLTVDCAVWRADTDTDHTNAEIVGIVQDRMLYRVQEVLGPGVTVHYVSLEP